MRRILLVTNDFPPRRGGIQSYLEALVEHLVATGEYDLTVYAPKWKGAEDYDDVAAATGYRVVRHPGTLMVPEPTVALRMRRLIREHDIDTVWFGAAAPLALLTPMARAAGAQRVIASTHGHEVGWSMLPVARTALRRIGDDTDVVTYISSYTRGRFASAFGPDAALELVPPGVDTERFVPDEVARAELRARYGLGERPVVVCVSRLVPRKGQDMLIRAMPAIRDRVPDAALVIVGGGPVPRPRCTGWRTASRWPNTWSSPTGCPARSCRPTTRWPTCSRCRAGPAGPDWTSRVSASSTWRRPRPAFRWWRAAPAARRRRSSTDETGFVVDGWDVGAIAATVGDLLADPCPRRRDGRGGRASGCVDNWQWSRQAQRLARLL